MQISEIIHLLRIKDEKGLSYLYDHYSSALNGIIIRILVSKNLSEEVLQQTFLKIWEKIDLYDENKSQLFTWMSRIAKNTAIDAKRSKEYENNKNTYSLDLQIHNQHNINISHASMDVQSLTSQLNDKHKIVLDCIYLNGYSQSETAKKLALPLGTVKSRVKAAICELRVILKDEKSLFLGSVNTIIILISILCL